MILLFGFGSKHHGTLHHVTICSIWSKTLYVQDRLIHFQYILDGSLHLSFRLLPSLSFRRGHKRILSILQILYYALTYFYFHFISTAIFFNTRKFNYSRQPILTLLLLANSGTLGIFKLLSCFELWLSNYIVWSKLLFMNIIRSRRKCWTHWLLTDVLILLLKVINLITALHF